ncbi:unnamed protein product [Gemmataceae bacterium]|nr:unnamed protein product [Gemmataceae bacterium]VTU00851.1 unnamed protein product [Gemmataceae bacterium]
MSPAPDSDAPPPDDRDAGERATFTAEELREIEEAGITLGDAIRLIEAGFGTV